MKPLHSYVHFALVVALAAGCKKPAPPPAPEAPAAASKQIVELSEEGLRNAEVRTAKLSPQTFGPRITATATIAADPKDIARLGARVSGRVMAILVKLGDEVAKGQPLVEIDAVELHQVSMEFLTAAARVKEADDALSRQQQLVAERVGALADLRRAEANATAAHATLSEAEEHLHFLGLTDDGIRTMRNGSSHGSERSVLRAPFAGRVAALTVALGQVLSGTEDIVTVTRSSTVQALLRIYERDLAHIATGTQVEIRVPSYPGRAFAGTIAATGGVVDGATRTMEVRAAIADPSGALKPGMSATAAISLRNEGPKLYLPTTAVLTDGAEHFVFLRIGERRFESHPVVVGPEQGGVLPIESGLSSGAEVVVHGAFALRGQLERAELEE